MLSFSIVAFVSCLIGRAINIFPLSFIANFCRERSNKITGKTQVVLWFAGLRGAIAFALSENMVSEIRSIYLKYKFVTDRGHFGGLPIYVSQAHSLFVTFLFRSLDRTKKSTLQPP